MTTNKTLSTEETEEQMPSVEICFGNSKSSVPSTVAAYSGISLQMKTEDESEEMKSLPYECFGALENKTYLMNQENSEFIKSDATKFNYYSAKEICLDVLMLHVVDETPLNYDAHNQLCNAMGGRMLTFEEIKVLKLFLLDNLSDNNSTLREHHENKTETYLWLHGNKTRRFAVLGLGCPTVLSSDLKILQTDVELYYAACDYQSLPNFCIAPRLRKFYLYSSLTIFGNEFFLDSEAATMLLYNAQHAKMYKKNNHWHLSARFYKDLATLDINLHPIGRSFWLFRGKKYQVTVTACNTEEFACSDGQCLPQSVRCNNKVECKDESDEDGCKFIRKQKSYQTTASPPPQKSQIVAQVKLDMKLVEIADISSNDGIIKFELLLFYLWRDPRLKIWYPSAGQKFPCSQIWYPHLHMVQGRSSGFQVPFNYNFQTCQIIDYEEQYIQKSFKDPYMGNYIEGEHVEIQYSIDTMVKLPCRLNLRRYPFSIQQCAINIWFYGKHSRDPQLIFLFNSSLYEQEIKSEIESRYLGEFYLTTAKVRFNINYRLSVILQLELENLYGFHMLNSFTPSLLIFVVCFATLFLPLKDVNERIVVPLTALLVLSTLFAQASSNAVRTAYFKLLDIWYVVLTIFCFLILMFNILVYKRLIKSKKRIKCKHHGEEGYESLVKSEPHIRNAYWYNLMFKYTISIAFLAFFIIFSLLAANII